MTALAESLKGRCGTGQHIGGSAVQLGLAATIDRGAKQRIATGVG